MIPGSARVLDGDVAALRGAVANDPATARTVGIRGVGGHGKSTLLDQLARAYAEAGVRVADAVELLDHPSEGAVLVDDAHRLDANTLSRLCAFARMPGARLIVAYRPYPWPAGLNALVSELDTAVSLPGWSVEELTEQAGRVFAGPVEAEWARWLATESGGVPRFAVRVLTALNGSAFGGTSLNVAPGETPVPTRALDQFHHDLDQLGRSSNECLLALVLGASPQPGQLAELLDVSPEQARETLSMVRASGLVDQNDAPVPIVRIAVLRLIPREFRLRLTQRLIDDRLRQGGQLLPVMRALLGEKDAENGFPLDASLARGFERAGTEALDAGESPDFARRLLDAAVAAGAGNDRVNGQRARAAVLAGDFDAALWCADEALVDEHAADRAWAARVGATVLGHRALLGRCAELCHWSTSELSWPGDRAFAVVGLLGVGRMEQAHQLLRAPGHSGPPTVRSGVTEQLAEGIWESVAGSATAALSTLVRAASMAESTDGTVAPDSPAALTALVALHCGEPEVARSTLGRALEHPAGHPLMCARHRLIAALLALSQGDTLTVYSELKMLESAELRGRDRLFATALHVGAANRDNDTAELGAVRGHARQVIAEHPVDLYALLPLGELILAAARLGDHEWAAPYRREALALLDHLGNPPLWSAPLHWKCVQAAVVVNDWDTAREHMAYLKPMTDHNPLAAAVSAASEVWLRALAGDVDAEQAKQAADELYSAGLPGDAARLAGQVAIHATERPVMLGLLESARALQGKPSRPRSVSRPNEDVGEPLSAREREVAELVLAGMTYKQIGKRLFISAKTVEHHIGRMKQRLGSASREELLTRLRVLLDG